MKRTLIGLAILGLLLTTAPAFAATSNTNVQIVVGADASISVPATCTLTTAGAFANWTGVCTASYSVRTTKVGGTGSITLAASTDWVATGGGAGPLLATDNLSFTASSNTGPGTANGTLTRIAATGTSYNVVTAMGANAHANNKTVDTNYVLVNNASWETDTYKVTVVYTIASS